jgi:hypothetical protein
MRQMKHTLHFQPNVETMKDFSIEDYANIT